MADTKITDLDALAVAPATDDLLVIVDVSDTTMAASGTDKQITVEDLLANAGSDSGFAQVFMLGGM